MNVTKIENYQNRETIAALRDLLERAERGAVRGMAFTIKVRGNRHMVGFTGDYHANPHEMLGVITRMEYKVNQLISALDDDPETTSMPL